MAMQRRERDVLHLNVADFSVAVEQVVDLSLKGKPVIIAPLGASRTVVHDMSEEAYRDGVRKNMPLVHAMRRSRRAKVLPPRFELYKRAMSAFIKEAHSFTPMVEYGLDDGHLYLDITGTHRLFGPPPDVGLRLQRNVQKDLRINPIWTYASNKLVAKVASRLVKPVGEYIVAAGEEKDFLAPLPINILPGIKHKEQASLREFNLSRIGEISQMTREQLSIPFGKRSDIIHKLSQGIDTAPVQVGDPQKKSLVAHYIFAEDSNERRLVESVIISLVHGLAKQLREQRRAVRRVGIWLHYSDGACCVRNATRKKATSLNNELVELGLQALTRAWTRRVRIRSCQISCDLFQPISRQLQLFETVEQKEKKQVVLTGALETIKKRFGNTAIVSAKQARFKKQLEYI